MADAVSDDELLDGGQGLTSSEVFTLDEDDTHPGTKGMPRGGFTQVGYLTILRQFAVLGWTAFGGPAAHIATFEQVFVERKTWLSSNVFTEFLALGYVPHQTQPPRPRDRPRHRLADLPFSLSPASLSPHRQCIPGPTSTQMAFAIGVVKRGTLGGLLSGAMFLHPGFIMMSIIGATTGGYLSEPSAVVKGLVAGFTAVAIALVAGAAASLGRKICKDRVTLCICTFSIFVTVYARQAWVMPLLMVLGAAVTTGAYRKKDLSEEAAGTKGEGSDKSGGRWTHRTRFPLSKRRPEPRLSTSSSRPSPLRNVSLPWASKTRTPRSCDFQFFDHQSTKGPRGRLLLLLGCCCTIITRGWILSVNRWNSDWTKGGKIDAPDHCFVYFIPFSVFTLPKVSVSLSLCLSVSPRGSLP